MVVGLWVDLKRGHPVPPFHQPPHADCVHHPPARARTPRRDRHANRSACAACSLHRRKSPRAHARNPSRLAAYLAAYHWAAYQLVGQAETKSGAQALAIVSILGTISPRWRRVIGPLAAGGDMGVLIALVGHSAPSYVNACFFPPRTVWARKAGTSSTTRRPPNRRRFIGRSGVGVSMKPAACGQSKMLAAQTLTSQSRLANLKECLRKLERPHAGQHPLLRIDSQTGPGGLSLALRLGEGLSLIATTVGLQLPVRHQGERQCETRVDEGLREGPHRCMSPHSRPVPTVLPMQRGSRQLRSISSPDLQGGSFVSCRAQRQWPYRHQKL